MKTLEDFKGTKEPIKVVERLGIKELFTDVKIATVHYQFEKTSETNANAKLFANSYKLLEKAWKALDELKVHKASLLDAAGFSKEEIKMLLEKNEFLNEFEQAIQDCL